jgi:parallel beta-helix repeat protein
LSSQKTKIKNRKLALIPLIILLASLASFSFGYVYGQITLSFQTIIEEGSMVTESSYIIFADGLGYYARNGQTGAMDYEGTIAITVINDALSSLTSGREWLETLTLKGNFTLTNVIDIGAWTYLDLTDARLTMDNNVDSSCIYVGNYSIIEGGFLVGNKDHNSAGSGIVVNNQYFVKIHHIEIHEFADSGIHIGGPRGVVFITDCVIISNGKSGIYIAYSGDNIIMSNDIGGHQESGYAGITLLGGAHNLIEGNNVYVNDNGIILCGSSSYGAYENIITGNRINTNDKEGIWIYGDTDTAVKNTVSNNLIKDNSQASSGTYSGITVSNQADNVITGNVIQDTQSPHTQAYGLNIVGTSTNTMVTSNNVRNNLLGGISCVSYVTNKVRDNLGWITEAWGQTTVANAEWISTGMSLTPTNVQITMAGILYDDNVTVVSLSSISGTSFQVYVAWVNGTIITNDVIDIYWYAHV